MDFPGGSDGKESAYSVGDPASIPGLGGCALQDILVPLLLFSHHFDFPGGSLIKESACNAGDLGLIPG